MQMDEHARYPGWQGRAAEPGGLGGEPVLCGHAVESRGCHWGHGRRDAVQARRCWAWWTRSCASAPTTSWTSGARCVPVGSSACTRLCVLDVPAGAVLWSLARSVAGAEAVLLCSICCMWSDFAACALRGCDRVAAAFRACIGSTACIADLLVRGFAWPPACPVTSGVPRAVLGGPRLRESQPGTICSQGGCLQTGAGCARHARTCAPTARP